MDAIDEAIIVLTKVMEAWKDDETWKEKGDWRELMKHSQLSFSRPENAALVQAKFPLDTISKWEVLNAVRASEFAVDFQLQATGLCNPLGLPGCESCTRETTTTWWVRYVRESGPFKPDLNGQFGFNTKSVIIIEDGRCKIREKADREPAPQE